MLRKATDSRRFANFFGNSLRREAKGALSIGRAPLLSKEYCDRNCNCTLDPVVKDKVMSLTGGDIATRVWLLNALFVGTMNTDVCLGLSRIVDASDETDWRSLYKKVSRGRASELPPDLNNIKEDAFAVSCRQFGIEKDSPRMEKVRRAKVE